MDRIRRTHIYCHYLQIQLRSHKPTKQTPLQPNHQKAHLNIKTQSSPTKKASNFACLIIQAYSCSKSVICPNKQDDHSQVGKTKGKKSDALQHLYPNQQCL